MTKIQKRLNSILTVVMIFSALVCIFVSVQIITRKEASIFGFRIYNVLTGSMEPTIATGSNVIVRKVNPAKLKAGDIITFISRDSAIYGAANTHRIIAVETDLDGKLSFVTQGDANQSADSARVYPEDIKGKVVFRMNRSVSLFLGFLRTPTGFVLVIVFPLMLVIWLFMRDFRRQVDQTSRAEAERQLREAEEAAAAGREEEGDDEYDEDDEEDEALEENGACEETGGNQDEDQNESADDGECPDDADGPAEETPDGEPQEDADEGGNDAAK